MPTSVTVNYADVDQIVVAGGTPSVTVSTSARGNGYRTLAAATAADQDKTKHRRYFPKSGLYKVRFVYLKTSDAGKLDIGLDTSTNNIFSQIDAYAGSTTYNNAIEKFVEIARGGHDLIMLVNGKNASSSDYVNSWQFLEFDLVAEYPVAGESDAAGSAKLVQVLDLTMTDESTAPSTGVKIVEGIPYDCVVTESFFYVTTPGTGATLIEADALIESAVNSNSFTSVYTTRPTVDASEYSSVAAATPSILNPAQSKFVKGTRIQGKIQAVDTGAAARGLKLHLITSKTL